MYYANRLELRFLTFVDKQVIILWWLFAENWYFFILAIHSKTWSKNANLKMYIIPSIYK